jgi:hypothetical protein
MATYQEITNLLDQKLNKFRHYKTDYLEECLKLVTKDIKDELHKNIASPDYLFLVRPDQGTNFSVRIDDSRDCKLDNCYQVNNNEIRVYFGLILKPAKVPRYLKPLLWCKFYIGIVKQDDKHYLMNYSGDSSKEIYYPGHQTDPKGNLETVVREFSNFLLDRLFQEISNANEENPSDQLLSKIETDPEMIDYTKA